MALNQLHFYSDSLGRYTTVNLILPLPRRLRGPIKPLPTLYLLHGMGDDYTAWLHKTAVEEYALRAGLAVAMPDGGLSCWENMAHGGAYRRFVLDELPQIMRRCMPLSHRREDNFIAGCSMGGFGALKLGLAAPEMWSAIGCFSAGRREYQPDSPRHRSMLRNAYGDCLPEIEAQVERDILRAAGTRLMIWHGCGDRDILRECAEEARNFMANIDGLDYRFTLFDGAHNWPLWDRMLERFIADLHLPTPEVRLM